MSELYLDPSLYDYVDGLDHESYERFCMVVDACAKALQLMSMKPDVCTARAFGVTVRVQRNAEKNYYVICAIDIVELDPPPEGWGANAAALMETYFDIAPDCVSERALPKKAPPEADRGQRFIGSSIEQKIQTSLFSEPLTVLLCDAPEGVHVAAEIVRRTDRQFDAARERSARSGLDHVE